MPSTRPRRRRSVESVGGEILYAAEAAFRWSLPTRHEWDTLASVRYPSVQAFLDMVANPDYPRDHPDPHPRARRGGPPGDEDLPPVPLTAVTGFRRRVEAELEAAAAAFANPLTRALLLLTVTTGPGRRRQLSGLGHVSPRTLTGNIVFLGFGIAGAGGLPVLAPLISLRRASLRRGNRRHAAPGRRDTATTSVAALMAETALLAGGRGSSSAATDAAREPSPATP